METFVVRLWVPAGPAAAEGTDPLPLRGVVDHVASGGSASFRGTDELIELLRSLAAAPDPSPARSGQGLAV